MITQVKGCAKGSRLIPTRIVALIVAIAALCACTAFAASPSLVHTVDIYDGSEVTRVETLKNDAAAILKQAGITLGPNDRMNLEAFKADEDSSITVYRASSIEYTDLEGNTQSVVFAGTVDEFLASHGVKVSDELLLSYPTNTVVFNGMKLSVQNAHSVTVNADGNVIEFTMGNGTVKDALAVAEVELSEDDEVTPALDEEVYDGIVINVNRVTYETRTVEEQIAFDKQTKNTDTLYKGETKVEQKGVNGVKEVIYRDKYVNGVLDSSSVQSERVTREPVSQITLVGTKAKQTVVTAVKNGGAAISELTPPSWLKIENGVPTSYKSVVNGKAAAYYDVNHTGRTASGRPTKPGYIAVDPKQFPYGTEMWIVATDGTVYGYCIAADTGGFVGGKFTVDLFMNTRSECYAWGSRDVIIYVLN